MGDSRLRGEFPGRAEVRAAAFYSHGDARLFSNRYKMRQFVVRGGKSRMAAAHADLDFLNEQNAGMTDILQTAEMDVHLNTKFRVVT